MGFIERSAGIASTSKMVMSFWLMIPAEVLAAVGDGENPEDFASDGFCSFCFWPALDRVIPLFVFGSQEVGTSEAGAADGEIISPSYVGIDCFGDDYTLCVNLQMSNFATGDITAGTVQRPECFYMGGGNGTPEGDPRMTIVGGQKHHVLLSFDISTSCTNTRVDGMDSFTPGPTFTWAIDGVPKGGSSTARSGDWESNGAGATGIIPKGILTDIDGADGSEAVWSPVSLDLGNPMGFPSINDFVSSVFNLKMSEVQIYTDVSVDCRDSDVIECFRTESGRPASPSLAQALCGKEPEIYFRTHSDWITGNNSGTAGDFTPTGTILATDEPT